MVTVQLDKERHLRLSLEGMLRYEEETGKSMLEGIDFKKMSDRERMALMWACLVHEDENLTFKDFRKMLDIGMVARLTKAVTACINEAFPDQEDKKGHPLARMFRRG